MNAEQDCGIKMRQRPKPTRGKNRHKKLIAAILKGFLPRWGQGAVPHFVRGQHNSKKGKVRDGLLRLGFSFEDCWQLPDIVAYSESKNWLFLIEAVHSAGPISPLRLLELQRLTGECSADIVYLTAFLNRDTFRKFSPDIAWETEVWIADAPDHLVHFDGAKFLGPYKST
jgi:type II restriction enzyme